MKQKSLGRSAALNGLRTAVDLLFPIVTFPYISRVLAVDNVGAYNFAGAVISYFLMLAGLGITTYAIREGSKLREDRKALDRFASEVFTINLVSTAASYLLLWACVACFPALQGHQALLAMFSIQIFFTTLGTEWLYAVFEEFAYITVRSIAFKILSLVLLCILVRSEGDLIAYAGITVFAHVGSNVLNFFHARRFCTIRPVLGVPWRRHMGPIMVIFSSSVAISIYTCSDSTLLGLLRSEHEVGVYAVSAQIYALAKTMLSAVLIVAVPRLSLYLGSGRTEDYRRTLARVSEGVATLLLPTVLMLFFLAEEFILTLSDASFLEATGSLRLLAAALVFCLTGWIANDCVLIPARREKVVLVSTLVSASLNIALDFILIPRIGVDAVGWSTLAAEGSVMLISIVKSADVAGLDRSMAADLAKIAAASLSVPAACLYARTLGLGAGGTLAAAAALSAAAYALLLVCFRTDLSREALSLMRRK
ncbi:MAG: flippase [Mailhella sp.]|nr:flippase [Mailhella sp.]